MRIVGIDARFYGPLGKGLGRYTQEVVDRVIEKSKSSSELNLSFVIFLSPENFDEFQLKNERVSKVKLPFRWYSVKEQLLFPFYIKKYNLDLIHFLHFNIPIFCPTKFIVTIHDLILTRFPAIKATTRNKFIYILKNLAYRLVLRRAINNSLKIITISEFTKKDIISLFKVASDKIVLIYEGAANLELAKDSRFVEKQVEEKIQNYPSKFLLYVGSAYPHKNLERLLKVFNVLEKEGSDIYLVLVGKSDFFYERLKKDEPALELIKARRIFFPGYVSDVELSSLYSKALAFIFPSLYEGFGLPPLEAMSKSCPVLSSDHSCLPEILEDSALYFNPQDLNDIVNKIKIINQDESLRTDLVRKGLLQVKKYSWDTCAEKTLKVYLDALGLNNI
ncbi:glycosyltransferase family 4 protein [Candidatus Falkowbacteria bacterium]|nr:glycosyltransferase family 4 protein [Candidatus Falkowbacteria bacterium]